MCLRRLGLSFYIENNCKTSYTSKNFLLLDGKRLLTFGRIYSKNNTRKFLIQKVFGVKLLIHYNEGYLYILSRELERE